MFCINKSHIYGFFPCLGPFSLLQHCRLNLSIDGRLHMKISVVSTPCIWQRRKGLKSTLSPSTWACRIGSDCWCVGSGEKLPGSDECCHMSHSSHTGRASLSCHYEVLLSHHSPPYFSLHFIQTSVT